MRDHVDTRLESSGYGTWVVLRAAAFCFCTAFGDGAFCRLGVL